MTWGAKVVIQDIHHNAGTTQLVARAFARTFVPPFEMDDDGDELNKLNTKGLGSISSNTEGDIAQITVYIYLVGPEAPNIKVGQELHLSGHFER